MSARGLLVSGNRYSGEMQIRLTKIRDVVQKVIALRAELGRRFPELLKEQHLKMLEEDLAKYIDSAAAGFVDRLSSRPLDPGGAVREALRGHLEREARSIQVKVKSDLQA